MIFLNFTGEIERVTGESNYMSCSIKQRKKKKKEEEEEKEEGEKEEKEISGVHQCAFAVVM